jgi:poly(3-hydroxybutyrate) depolymerase
MLATALGKVAASVNHHHMVLVGRSVALAVVCALTLGCSDDGGSAGMPGLGGAGASAGGGGSANQGGSGAGTTNAGGGSGGSNAGASASGSGSGGMTAGMAGMGGTMIDENGGAPSGPASGRHTAKPSGSMPGTTAGYYEYLPPHYGNGALYPLLVFRHGVGENGNGASELDKVLAHGPPKLIEADAWPEARNFVVLSVQHPGSGCPTSQEMDDFFTFALDSYDIDPKRVYLTGLSCGAIGSWNYLADHLNEDVAAAVLICGDARGAFDKAQCNLGKVPIWAFHGDQDTSVTIDKAQVPIESLEECESPAPVDLRFTVYPGVPHDSWTMTYDSSNPQNDIYAWLLTHEKD